MLRDGLFPALGNSLNRVCFHSQTVSCCAHSCTESMNYATESITSLVYFDYLLINECCNLSCKTLIVFIPPNLTVNTSLLLLLLPVLSGAVTLTAHSFKHTVYTSDYQQDISLLPRSSCALCLPLHLGHRHLPLHSVEMNIEFNSLIFRKKIIHFL